jgi:c-di-GMP-binding flagellar brake protein YcgR
MLERRKSVRVALTRSAAVRAAGAEHACQVTNISAGGARMCLPDAAAVPAEFTLVLTHDGAVSRPCRVVWRSQTDLGVAFQSVMPSARFPRQADARRLDC